MCKSAVKYFNHINFLNYYSAEGQFIGIILSVAGFFVCGGSNKLPPLSYSTKSSISVASKGA